jgi:peptidoglycan-associated lipoprotein
MAHARLLVGCSLLAVAAVAAGCAPKPAADRVTSPSGSGSGRNGAVTAARPASQNLAVGDDIRRACQISVGSIEKAPKFDFDRSDLEANDRDVLTQIARCLTTGPLKGRAVKLVGRADSRGEPEYNMGLGEHRAGSVKGYLTQLGVDSRKVAETSRGELDANGTNDDGWQRDRRVDVLLQ